MGNEKKLLTSTFNLTHVRYKKNCESTHLLSRRDLKGSELLLEFGNVVLEVEESLSNAQLDFISWGSASRLSNLVRGHGV
jgi:hypothetical protein